MWSVWRRALLVLLLCCGLHALPARHQQVPPPGTGPKRAVAVADNQTAAAPALSRHRPEPGPQPGSTGRDRLRPELGPQPDSAGRSRLRPELGPPPDSTGRSRLRPEPGLAPSESKPSSRRTGVPPLEMVQKTSKARTGVGPLDGWRSASKPRKGVQHPPPQSVARMERPPPPTAADDDDDDYGDGAPHWDATRARAHTSIVLAAVCSAALVLCVGGVLIRRAVDRWHHRHYRKMQVMVDDDLDSL